MQQISIFNKGISILLWLTDVYSKYAWVVLLKKLKKYYNYQSFPKRYEECGHKPNKTWVDKGSEIYNRSIKSW